MLAVKSIPWCLIFSQVDHDQERLLTSPLTTLLQHEYFREGAWSYLAAWDLHRAKLFRRCEKKTGIAPSDRVIAEVMSQEPYKSLRRVFWIMDNCSAHRGQEAVQRI